MADFTWEFTTLTVQCKLANWNFVAASRNEQKGVFIASLSTLPLFPMPAMHVTKDVAFYHKSTAMFFYSLSPVVFLTDSTPTNPSCKPHSVWLLTLSARPSSSFVLACESKNLSSISCSWVLSLKHSAFFSSSSILRLLKFSVLRSSWAWKKK